MAIPPTQRADDRRRSARATVSRPVLFAGTRGDGLLRQGQAVDISAGGIQIHTTQPELVGRHLELELHPEGVPQPGNVILVKGEVARVENLGKGKGYAMGVRFLQLMPATENTGARLRPATTAEAEDLAGSIQQQLDAMEPAATLELSGAARLASQQLASQQPTPRPRPTSTGKPRRSWRKLLLAALLLFLLPATLVPLVAGLYWGLYSYRGTPEAPAEGATPPLVEISPPPTDSPTSVLDRRLSAIESEGPAYYINRGGFLLVQGKGPAALQAFGAALSDSNLTPMQRFIAELGEAQALAMGGHAEEAIAKLEAPVSDPQFVPEPWLALKAAFLEGLYNTPETNASRMPLVNAFTFHRHPEGAGQGGPASDGEENPGSPVEGTEAPRLKIEVDTNRHLLTVLEDNAIKAVYPVGLGFDGKTPHGEFRITNKIKNPDWYNGGNVIEAGDPDNELGSRWMGLSDEEGPTPLGIHGTDDTASIGENLSRGCIRMRPEDVEELFTLVDPGTPVHIRAL